jgi:gas vesicle protein
VYAGSVETVGASGRLHQETSKMCDEQSNVPIYDMNDDKDDFSACDFLYGLVVGAAVGALTALALAPKPGEELRHDLFTVGADWKDRSGETLAGAREQLSETIDTVREKTSEALDHTRSAVTESVSRAREAIEDARKRLDEAVAAGKAAFASTKEELTAQVESVLEE